MSLRDQATRTIVSQTVEILWPEVIAIEARTEISNLDYIARAVLTSADVLQLRTSNGESLDESRGREIDDIIERHVPVPDSCEGCVEKERLLTQARQYATAVLAQIGFAEARLRTAAGDAQSIKDILSGPADTEPKG